MQTYQDIQAAVTKRFEKRVLVGYLDQGKVPTWGWGHTGPEVRVGQSITPEQADIDFIRDQAHADAKLHRHVKPDAWVTLSEHEKAAVLDFVFNTGGGPEADDKDCWTIWKDINSGNLADVVAQFNRFIYVHVDGKPVTSNGLKNRRAAEIVLWNTGDQEAAVAVANAGGQTVCSASCRVLPTPPTTTAPKPLAKTSLGLKISGLIASGGGLAAKAFTPETQDKATNLATTAAAHAASFGPIGHVVASVCGAGVVVIAAGMLLVHVSQTESAKV
jgi:lysozyme